MSGPSPQIDGEPLPAASDSFGDPGDKTALLTAAIQHHGIDLAYVDDLGGALGTSAGGRIQILNGLSPAVEFTTLVHEFSRLCTAIGNVRLLLLIFCPRSLAFLNHHT